MAHIVLQRLRRRFGDAIRETRLEHGHAIALVDPMRVRAIAEFLRDDHELDFDVPIDCTAVDYLGKGGERFEVIWHLYSLRLGHRVRLKVRIAESDPTCPSLTPVWRGMNWHEREAYDMYGIRFDGHPNLKRILMYEEFVGHPLRKDYPIDKRQPLIEMRPVREVPTERHPTRAMLNRP